MVFWWFFFVLTQMTPTQVLTHLHGLFPDRLVLYAEDLAQVLGKSRKAVQAHIADLLAFFRDVTPFYCS